MSLLLVEFTPDLSAPLTIERNLTIKAYYEMDSSAIVKKVQALLE
jgi:hypothetical protein